MFTIRSLAARLAGAALCVVVPNMVEAQAPNSGFEKGTKLLSLGVMGGGDYDGTGIGGILEWAVGALGKTTLSLGGFTGFQRQTRGAGTLETSSTVIPAMVVSNLHFPVPSNPKLDLYAGASVGLVRSSVSSNSTAVGDDDASNTKTGVGFQGGIRYNLAPRFGIVGQIGLGDIPLFFAGASFRL